MKERRITATVRWLDTDRTVTSDQKLVTNGGWNVFFDRDYGANGAAH
jgi:hypothetical protein